MCIDTDTDIEIYYMCRYYLGLRYSNYSIVIPHL